MAIPFACPGCATPFNVTEDMAGKRAKCPKCLMIFTLPAAKPAAAAAAPAAPAKKATAAVTADLFPKSDRDDPDRRPSRRSTRDDDDDDRDRDRGRNRDRDRDYDRDLDEPRPRRSKARRSKGSALPWVLGIGGVVLLMIIFCGGTITAVALIGLGGNANPVPPKVVVNNQPPGNQPAINVGPNGQVQLKQGQGTKLQLANGRATVSSQLNFQDPFDPKDKQFRCKLYMIELQAGRDYTIDMTSPNPQALDPYLRVEDLNENELAEDDDSGGNLNARITFRPNFTGSFVIVATSFHPNHAGPFTLSIRENGK
jgi:hypothetical protein